MRSRRCTASAHGGCIATANPAAAAGELVAAKRGSPMILGIKDSRQQPRTSFSRLRDADDSRWRSSAMECWVASDTSAILEYTKK